MARTVAVADAAKHCFLTTTDQHHPRHYLPWDSSVDLPKQGIATGEFGQ